MHARGTFTHCTFVNNTATDDEFEGVVQLSPHAHARLSNVTFVDFNVYDIQARRAGCVTRSADLSVSLRL